MLYEKKNICSQQGLKTDTFTSYRTSEMVKFFNQLNCKNSYLIYSLQCRICHIQYVGESESYFNIRLNNHRKDSKNKNAILASKCFHN